MRRGAIETSNVIHKVVVMGVSGSGKTTLARELSAVLQASFIEGDEHHCAGNRDKMRRGIALSDLDREPWLDILAECLTQTREHAVLSCSALKRRYRDRLRAQVAGLKFVFLDIAFPEAVARVSGRLGHEFPATLVADQFDTLESPVGESQVLHIPAVQDRERSILEIIRWLTAIHRI